jgi:hypothetical protein
VDGLGHLDGQFAGLREHERLDLGAREVGWLVDGDGEGGGLAVRVCAWPMMVARNVQCSIRLQDAVVALLPGPSEDLVSLGEKVAVGLQVLAVRGPDPSALKTLEAVDEHGAVDLIKEVSSDVDRQVRRDAENVRVEGRVVKLAQRKAIANGRFTLWVAVRQDVRGFEQLRVLQVADGTAPLIRLEHALPEALLMQSSLDHGGDIAASRIDGGRIVNLKGRRRNDTSSTTIENVRRAGSSPTT